MSAPAVVILAAGQGTRMRSSMPKMLHPLCGRPLVCWSVSAARDAGAARVVVVDGPERRLAESIDGQAEIAVQAQARGTADAVRAALGHLDGLETVIVLNGDVPLISPESIAGLAGAHERSGAAATIATVTLEDPSGYGRVVRAPDGTVERVVESKAPGDATERELHIREVNTGMFAFELEALSAALAEVRADNAQGEQYLPDVLAIMRRHERTVAAHPLPEAEAMLQVNDRRQLSVVRAVAQRIINERHMLAGVTIVDPQATVIDAGVRIEPDVVVEPFTSLHGATRVGEGAVVGPHATVHDSVLGARARVVHAYLDGAEVKPGVKVGPFASLGPGPVRGDAPGAGKDSSGESAQE